MPIPRPFHEIEKPDIEALISEGVREGRTIEYKQALPGRTDAEKKEFLADVSSLANTVGGDIVYGIVEQRDASGNCTGIPESARGVGVVNRGDEELRLESVLRSGLDPRLPSVHFKWIDGFPDGPVLVIRSDQSWTRPHMIAFQDSGKFYGRNSSGKYQLDRLGIRTAFALSADLARYVRTFREDRLARIIAGDAALPLPATPKIVLHVVPASAADPAALIDISKVAAQIGSGNLAPLDSGDYQKRYNLDGFLTWYGQTHPDVVPHSYVQVFRNGAIEAVESNLLRPADQNDYMPTAVVARELIRGSKRYLDVLRAIEIGPPVFLLATLIGVRGLRVPPPSGSFPQRLRQPIDRDVLLLPDVMVTDLSAETDLVLRPALDALWQAGDWPECPHYETGRWHAT